MKRRFRQIAILTIILILTSMSITSGATITPIEVPHQPLIAHAGGHIYGYKYTNSLEAIESSYNNGFKLIELDFEWTVDDQIVLIHDWEAMVKRLYMIEPEVLSYVAFKGNTTFQDLTLLDIYDLVNWLKDKDVYIVTDAKNRNIEFLEYVSTNFNEVSKKFIPQVYSFNEFNKARELGYKNIILTLYKANYTDEEIIAFAKNNPVYAITMPIERGYSQLPKKLQEMGIISYVHTVNDLYVYEELNANGVYGIYTDYFQANKWVK